MNYNLLDDSDKISVRSYEEIIRKKLEVGSNHVKLSLVLLIFMVSLLPLLFFCSWYQTTIDDSANLDVLILRTYLETNGTVLKYN